MCGLTEQYFTFLMPLVKKKKCCCSKTRVNGGNMIRYQSKARFSVEQNYTLTIFQSYKYDLK